MYNYVFQVYVWWLNIYIHILWNDYQANWHSHHLTQVPFFPPWLECLRSLSSCEVHSTGFVSIFSFQTLGQVSIQSIKRSSVALGWLVSWLPGARSHLCVSLVLPSRARVSWFAVAPLGRGHIQRDRRRAWVVQRQSPQLHRKPPATQRKRPSGPLCRTWVPATARVFLSWCVFFVLIFWLHQVALEILVLGPGVKPWPSALEAWSSNHWTGREVLVLKHSESDILFPNNILGPLGCVCVCVCVHVCDENIK